MFPCAPNIMDRNQTSVYHMLLNRREKSRSFSNSSRSFTFALFSASTDTCIPSGFFFSYSRSAAKIWPASVLIYRSILGFLFPRKITHLSICLTPNRFHISQCMILDVICIAGDSVLHYFIEN